MILQGLSIKKLFGQFDYDISLVNQDGIIILTGPNGYGKTTVLNIIYNLFVANFNYYQALNFESIAFIFSDNKKIYITKGKPETVHQRLIQQINGVNHETIQTKIFVNIHLDLQSNNESIDKYTYTHNEESKLLQGMINNLPFPDLAINLIKNQPGIGVEFDQDELREQLQKKAFDIVFPNGQNNGQHRQLRTFLCTQDIRFIKDQRIIKQITLLGGQNNKPQKPETLFIYTINNFRNDLKNQIAAKQTEAFQKGQQLDNTFPARILKPQKKLEKDEFDERIQKLAIKQKQLKEYGITTTAPAIPEYNTDKSDVLAVYLDDSEKKTMVFDELLGKINLFLKMLNEKQLVNKEIKIDGGNGFSIVTKGKKLIDPALLSSGEQQEIILLYELLFKTQPNTLILIDEPETSLHIMWQKAFVKDLLAITKIRSIAFCFATHSPQIINGRWDLVTDLYTLTNKRENPDFEGNDVG
ncbi:hypothetical protein AGMMS50267_16670 [Spirochaetia bacterium]|nr:hypothetical protein AGMMS50267_16670 [Spirochaetia bacterium]